jgi:hypothetical protein
MVLIFKTDPLDTEEARGHFYHVCRGRVEDSELSPPPDDKPYECPQCGIELEAEDFWVASLKGSV